MMSIVIFDAQIVLRFMKIPTCHNRRNIVRSAYNLTGLDWNALLGVYSKSIELYELLYINIIA